MTDSEPASGLIAANRDAFLCTCLPPLLGCVLSTNNASTAAKSSATAAERILPAGVVLTQFLFELYHGWTQHDHYFPLKSGFTHLSLVRCGSRLNDCCLIVMFAAGG